MTTPEAASIAELIADCADIPARVRTATPEYPVPATAAGWTVDEACLAQVRDLDVYP